MNEALWIGSTNPTRLGVIWVAVTSRGLAAVAFSTTAADFAASLQRQGYDEIVPDLTRTGDTIRQIEAYLAGERQCFDFPIDWSKFSPFQQEILQKIYAIPYGEVTTYGELARQSGRPRAARAVGRVCATNPMPLVIPCHRVLGSDGKLHGYGGPGGIETKAWLQEMEREKTPRM